MKFFGVLTAAALATGMIGTTGYSADMNNADTQSVLQTYEQQVGYQRRVILEERKALDTALANRDNSVHISKDLLNVLAYGVSSGFLTYDFLRGTQNMQSVRSFLFQKKVPGTIIPASDVEAESPVAARVSAAERSGVLTPERVAMAREVGVTAFRVTEAVSAAALAIFFVDNAVDTGKDIIVRFKDTDEIRAHRSKLVEAERNLDAADQNLEVAVLAEQQ